MLAAAAAGTPLSPAGGSESTTASKTLNGQADAIVIDTNVDLCCWPYRTLKYGKTEDLVAKLSRHGVRQAWAGSYDALFHKNLDAVNQKLADECQSKGGGMLVPFGAVNPAWPDWEEDVRRIDEEYGMAGIKLIPGYHGYTLDDLEFVRLLEAAADRELLVQIAIDMEDERMRHPRVMVPVVDVSPLPAALRRVPGARVVLVNPFRHVRRDDLSSMITDTNVHFEISNLDGTGGLERILRGEHWYLHQIPADRLLFGSHVPFFPLENSLFKFVESNLSESEYGAILYGNAERLLSDA